VGRPRARQIKITNSAKCPGREANEQMYYRSYKQQYYDIDAGVLRRFSYSPTRQTRHLSGLVIHKYYNSLTLQNDIALGLLSEPLYFNAWVRPARLPDVYRNFFVRGEQQPYPGQRCVAVGWGASREGGPDRKLIHERVTLPSPSFC
jgi:hypothetical protein